jgi:para-aminobenzoate synthetase
MSFDALATWLAEELRERVARTGRAVVALDGFGCCGKSTLARALAERTDAVILETDDFHQPHGGVVEAGSPLSYRRWSALQAAALALATGQPARYAPIDWDTHCLAPEVTVEPRPLLIIDGIGAHALALPARPLNIFVDGRAASRMARVAARDGPQYANWDHYVAIEHGYLAKARPWRNADLVVLGAELDFSNSAEGFARRMEVLADTGVRRLDAPL